MTDNLQATWQFTARDLRGTERLGQALAKCLPERALVALDGPLGAGKTRLVQAIASGCGVPQEQVTSPTFVLIHEYQGERPVWHFDAYRLADEDEFLELGAAEYFAEPGICLVEWAERVANCLPDDHLAIRISISAGDGRLFELRGSGEAHASAVDAIRRQLESGDGEA